MMALPTTTIMEKLKPTSEVRKQGHMTTGHIAET